MVGQSGQEISLHSEIDPAEGAFLHKVISEDTSVNRTLEIGCAVGLSLLHISDALSSRPQAHHTILDPFQMPHWNGVGVERLNTARVPLYQLIEQRSEIALPELPKAGEARFDFIFVATAFQTHARRMLAFQKIADDERGWDWFPDGF